MGSQEPNIPCLHRLIILFLYLFNLTCKAQHYDDEMPIEMTTSEDNSFMAIYAFGDSYVDSGNNNYIFTPFRVNYGPYGRDLPDEKPTGRCSNGRLITDLLASYLGIKNLLPPYLNPKFTTEDLMTGVSFASSGTGYDSLTSIRANLLSMEKQASYFKEYKTKLVDAIGAEAAEDIIEDGLFFVHCATNDIVNNYFKYPIRRFQYTIDEYQQFLIGRFREFVQSLLDQGARKFAICGVPPLGCLPTVIDTFSDNPSTNRSCVEIVSSAATSFNQLLQHELHDLQTRYEDVGAKFVYIDMYEPLMNLIENPKVYGFLEGRRECCSSKVFGLCLPKFSTICEDASEYVFWDFIHPTEKANVYLLESFLPKIDFITSTD